MKRLKNRKQLYGIKYQGKRRLSMVNGKRKEPTEIVLLKDWLDYIFTNFSSNFNSTGNNFLKKLAKDEEKTDYHNLFFEIDDPDINSYDFLEYAGMLDALLINLLNEN